LSAPSPRPRKPAIPPTGRTVKTSVSVRAELHARWAAAAALSGMDRNAFAVMAITEAVKGIHIMDRRKTAGPVGSIDRRAEGLQISSDDEEAA
jgi:hypothetical protein